MDGGRQTREGSLKNRIREGVGERRKGVEGRMLDVEGSKHADNSI